MSCWSAPVSPWSTSPSRSRARTPGPGRVLHAVSRSGRLPKAHVSALKLAAIPDITEWGSTLDEVTEQARQHVLGVVRASGDWRPAIDGLRFQVSSLWERLSGADRVAFLAHDAGRWNVLRHRMAPSSAAFTRELRGAGRLTVASAEVADARPLPRGGVEVTLTDGTVRAVGWVVNCTGPQADVRLLGTRCSTTCWPGERAWPSRPRPPRAWVSAPTGGACATPQARRRPRSGRSVPCAAGSCGSPRRCRRSAAKASSLATAVLDEVAPLPRRLADGRVVSGHHPVARPRDPLGLPLSTTAEAAAMYNAGLERVMRLQSGGEELIRDATLIDPDFALAHAALAMLGYEAGGDADVQASLGAAQQAVRRRGDARESSFVDVVARRVNDVRRVGARALMAHIAGHPRDVLAVSAAVPTIAFSGVTDVQRESWDLVEGLAPAYGDHWWYISLLAFTRQDQGRFDEAGLLAESALSCEPSSGHAVHAQTHVLYETGQHESGRVWLDHWVAESGRSASHRAHFSWHAALRARARGHGGGSPPLLLPARAAGGHRRAGADRLRVPAVALAGHHRGLGSRRRHGVVAATRVRRGGPSSALPAGPRRRRPGDAASSPDSVRRLARGDGPRRGRRARTAREPAPPLCGLGRSDAPHRGGHGVHGARGRGRGGGGPRRSRR